MGPIVLKSISPLIHRQGGAIDVHLMVDQPVKYFEPVAAAGGDSVTFHYEAVADVAATIRAAREHGLQAGVAFNPESEPEEVAAVSGDADIVLCMGIHPGYSGQQFIESTYDRVRRLRLALANTVHIQVDGGVGEENIGRIRDCGATLLVAAAFRSLDRVRPSSRAPSRVQDSGHVRTSYTAARSGFSKILEAVIDGDL